MTDTDENKCLFQLIVNVSGIPDLAVFINDRLGNALFKQTGTRPRSIDERRLFPCCLVQITVVPLLVVLGRSFRYPFHWTKEVIYLKSFSPPPLFFPSFPSLSHTSSPLPNGHF